MDTYIIRQYVAAMLTRLVVGLCTFVWSVETIQAEASIEIGTLPGAHFRIHKPTRWNRQLVIWCNGYTPVPVQFRSGDRVPEVATALLAEGYAFAESGYLLGGVAVDAAIQDSDTLRRCFQRKYPDTSAVYVAGESMGGLVALRLVEGRPQAYRAGLSFCGMLSTPFDYVGQAFDLLTLFAYFEPNVLPSPAEVPSDFRPSQELIERVANVLQANGAAAALLQHESGTNDIGALAGSLVFQPTFCVTFSPNAEETQ